MYIYIKQKKKLYKATSFRCKCTLMHSIFQNPLVNFVNFVYPDSHEWPRHSFSQQCQNNIKHTSDENEEKYKLGDY